MGQQMGDEILKGSAVPEELLEGLTAGTLPATDRRLEAARAKALERLGQDEDPDRVRMFGGDFEASPNSIMREIRSDSELGRKLLSICIQAQQLMAKHSDEPSPAE